MKPFDRENNTESSHLSGIKNRASENMKRAEFIRVASACDISSGVKNILLIICENNTDLAKIASSVRKHELGVLNGLLLLNLWFLLVSEYLKHIERVVLY